MKPSKTLLASVFLTAVILAVVSGFASSAMAQRQAEVQSADAEADAAAGQDAAPADLTVYQEREAAYQQTIEQANTQIQALQERLAQVEGPSAGPSVEGSSAAAAAVSPEQALQSAREAAGPGLRETKAPELVRFEGKAAYEVAFEAGSIYIDAQSGAVLFNGTVPPEITAEQAAQIASDYLGIEDILLVDQVEFRGSTLWRVIFQNSTIAYLDRTGQITYVLKDSNKPVTVQASDDDGGSFSGGFSDDDAHEDHDDDEHEDDDD